MAALLLLASAAASAPLLASALAFGFGSAASQDPLPVCATRVRCNGQFCADTCEDGSLALDPWLVRGIRDQYNLTRARSWRWGPILGTHNGFISRANGMGLTEDLASAIYARASPNVSDSHVRVPNQRFGAKSLLDLGVRELELDLWDTLVNDRDFEVVVCHSPVPDPEAVIDLQAAATRLGLGDDGVGGVGGGGDNGGGGGGGGGGGCRGRGGRQRRRRRRRRGWDGGGIVGEVVGRRC